MHDDLGSGHNLRLEFRIRRFALSIVRSHLNVHFYVSCRDCLCRLRLWTSSTFVCPVPSSCSTWLDPPNTCTRNLAETPTKHGLQEESGPDRTGAAPMETKQTSRAQRRERQQRGWLQPFSPSLEKAATCCSAAEEEIVMARAARGKRSIAAGATWCSRP